VCSIYGTTDIAGSDSLLFLSNHRGMGDNFGLWLWSYQFTVLSNCCAKGSNLCSYSRMPAACLALYIEVKCVNRVNQN
jgi:hypothetical protein